MLVFKGFRECVAILSPLFVVSWHFCLLFSGMGIPKPKIKKINHDRYAWMVSYSVKGKRIRKYFRGRDAARDHAEEVTATLLSTGLEIGELRPDERRALSLWRQAETELPLRPLDELIREELTRVRSVEGSSTIDSAIETLLERRRTENRKARTLADLEVRLRAVAIHFGGSTILATVTVNQVDEWLSSLNLSAQSVLNYRRVAHSLWAEGVRQGWCQSNPVSRAMKPNKPQREIGILVVADGRRLLAAADEEFEPCLLLQGWCGLRRSEVVDELEWSAITDTHVRIADGKTGRRLVPLQPGVAKSLQRLRRQGSLWTHTEQYYSACLGKLCSSLSIDLPRNALRHSFCTYRLAQAQNLAQTALEAGNSPEVIREHYAELVTQDEGQRWFAL